MNAPVIPPIPQTRYIPPAELPDHLKSSANRNLMNAGVNVAVHPNNAPVRKADPKSVLLFPSDRNGCGFYRTIVPFSHLISKYEYDAPTLFSFVFDLNFITKSKWLRFQRQVTKDQKKVIVEYRKVIKKINAETKMAFELDDLVHAIEPSNIVAYQFYTETRKQNLIDVMKMSDVVTFSTEFLKDFYKQNFGITHSVVVPNFLPKYLWQDKGKRNKRNKGSKPRILWAGSSSHVGKNGDLEFMIPLIRKTKNEFEWVFLGVMPPELNGQFEFHEWADFYSYPHALDSIDADVGICPIVDNTFNYAKSDLKLLEYTAINMPGIFSTIGQGMGPYDLVDGICTVNNQVDDWYNAIKKVISDESYRESIMNAQRAELNGRWLEDEKNIGHYLNIYK
jgi:glycosyltransferase involved in cell wall biosynthesis